MFHVHFQQPKEQVELVLAEVHQQTGIGLTSYVKEIDAKSCYFEVSLGDLYADVPNELVQVAFKRLNELMKQHFFPL